MTLGEKQKQFTKDLVLLFNKAFELGYEISLGDAYRDPRVFGKFGERVGYGESHSCHKLRLAIDLNLFRNGKYLQTTEAHRPLGEYWESIRPGNTWGGRFHDGNHYSVEHNGFR